LSAGSLDDHSNLRSTLTPLGIDDRRRRTRRGGFETAPMGELLAELACLALRLL